MDIEGGYILTEEQDAAWQQAYPEEYEEYIDFGLYDPETRELLDIPEWMANGDPNDGPFDFNLNPSHGTHGW